MGTPDWHYLPFTVVKSVTEIRVSYAYESIDTGVGFSANVIDIGLFDGSGHGLGKATGFRGWSGGARKSFRVSRHSATPGYLAGPLTPGTWSVILGPFTIVPPGVSWKVTVTLVHGKPKKRFKPKPAPRRVKGTGPGWYRGDLHLHTVHSDGHDTQRAMALSARGEGPRLHRLDRAQHHLGARHVGQARAEAAARRERRGDHHPQRPLDRRRAAAGLVDRLALPRRGREALALPAPGARPRRHRDRVPPVRADPGTMWNFGYDFAGMDAVEIWNGPWTLDDQVGVEAWHAMLVAGRFLPACGLVRRAQRQGTSASPRPSCTRRRCPRAR